MNEKSEPTVSAKTGGDQGPGATKLAAIIYFAALVAVFAFLWTSLATFLTPHG